MTKPLPEAIARIDCHLHVWDQKVLTYPWMMSRPDLPRQAAVPPSTDLVASNVAGVLLVEAGVQTGSEWQELDFLLTVHEQNPAVLGVIAAARCIDDRLLHSAVVGVRTSLNAAEAGARFSRTISDATGLGLTVDVLARGDALDVLADTLETCCDASVVLDHLGGAPFDQGWESKARQDWQKRLRRLAQFPQLMIKVSGQAPVAIDHLVTTDQCRSFLSAAVDAFGTHRAVLGSDWPVSGGGTPYGDWFSSVEKCLGDRWDAAAMHGAALRAYRLGAIDGADLRI